MIKYIICPQHIRSKNDGDIHYIGFIKLIELYGLDFKDCVDYNRNQATRQWDNLSRLYPRYDGKKMVVQIWSQKNDK